MDVRWVESLSGEGEDDLVVHRFDFDEDPLTSAYSYRPRQDNGSYPRLHSMNGGMQGAARRSQAKPSAKSAMDVLHLHIPSKGARIGMPTIALIVTAPHHEA